jgi:hypothetical protein
VLAPHFSAIATQDLNKLSCFNVSTDGTNRVSQKLFSLVTQYIHIVHGIKSKFIDLNGTPNKKSEAIANYVTRH